MGSVARSTSCTRQKGICLTVMAVPLFISVYLLIFLNLDFINRKQSNDSTQNSRLHIQSLVRMQRAIDDLHYDLSQVTDHRDSLLRHIVSVSRNISRSGSIQDIKDSLPFINRIEKYQTYVLQSIVRYKPYMLTCDQLAAVQVLGILTSKCNKYSNVFHGFYGLEDVFLVKPKTELCIVSDRKYDNDCLINVNYQLTKEIMLLQQIRHPNVVKLLGYCTKNDDLLYVTEAGRSIDMKNITNSDWLTKLRVLHSIATIFFSLSQSAAGSLGLNISETSLTSPLFVRTMTGHIKLASAAALLSREPFCKDDYDCYVHGKDKGIMCRESRCKGFNVQKTQLDLVRYYLKPLLQNSPDYINAQVRFAQQKLNDMEPKEIVTIVGKWKEKEEDRTLLGSKERVKIEKENKLKSLLGQGGQVIEMSDIINSWPAGPGDVYKYRKIEKTDMPSENDYPCPRSLYPWGCVHSLKSLSEVFVRCNGDPQCRAVVVYTSNDKASLEVVFKTGSERRVSSDSTTLYIKELISEGNAVNIENLNDIYPGPQAIDNSHAKGDIPASMLQPCLDDMFHMQQIVRSDREKLLMKQLGLQDVSEDEWKNLVSTAPVLGSESINPPSSEKGDVILSLDGRLVNKTRLIHTEGMGNNYLAHLGFYHLDRLLGLYRIIPTAYRKLNNEDVKVLAKKDSAFKNQFSSLITDSSLDGILITPATSSPTLLSLPKFANFTNSVIQLSSDQHKQLEYLMLMWLTGTPRSLKQVSTVQGSALHVIATDAFQQGVDDLLPYFYGCQFPRHAVEILWSLQDEATDYCTLASQLLYELNAEGVSPSYLQNRFSSPHIIATIVNKAAETLVHIIDTCIDKFGEAKVLYV